MSINYQRLKAARAEHNKRNGPKGTEFRPQKSFRIPRGEKEYILGRDHS